MENKDEAVVAENMRQIEAIAIAAIPLMIEAFIEAFREILVECCESSESEVERYHTIAKMMLALAGAKQE